MTTTSPQVDGEIVIDNLSEKTIRFEALGTRDPIMSVGDGATFYNEIYDADGNVYGETVGITVAVDLGENGIVTEYTEVIELPDGMLHATSRINRMDLFTGKTVTAQVVGRSGRYAGMTGVRECRLLPPFPPGPDNKVGVRFVLHRA